jgi:hypothetical protein
MRKKLGIFVAVAVDRSRVGWITPYSQFAVEMDHGCQGLAKMGVTAIQKLCSTEHKES